MSPEKRTSVINSSSLYCYFFFRDGAFLPQTLRKVQKLYPRMLHPNSKPRSNKRGSIVLGKGVAKNRFTALTQLISERTTQAPVYRSTAHEGVRRLAVWQSNLIRYW